MRQKKSNAIFYYIIGIVLIIGLLFVSTRESNVKVEKVEQVLENNFTK